MNNTMCEKCKFKYESEFNPPCIACKYSYPRDTTSSVFANSQFTPADSQFTPADDAAEIDHPAHYAGKIECIDALLETMGRDDVRAFCLCNAFKYLWRCKKKHDTPTEDVEKAVWYLQKYLELGGKS